MSKDSTLIIGGIVALVLISRANGPRPQAPIPAPTPAALPPQYYGDPGQAYNYGSGYQPQGTPVSQDVLNYTQAATGLLGAIGNAYDTFHSND